MSSVHTPERHPGESQQQYRERREASQCAARRITGHSLGGSTNSRAQFRDSMRKSGTMGKRIRASDALMASWASKRITKAKLRDQHGAYTLTGSPYEMQAREGMTIHPSQGEHVFGGAFGNGGHTDYTARRKWLAGISAQRGY